MESLFLKKTDINTVLDWLKNAEVGRNWYLSGKGKINPSGLSFEGVFMR